MKLKPVNGHILVRDMKKEEKTSSGIYMPESISPEQMIRGEVLEKSEEWIDKKGIKRNNDFLRTGDIVLYNFHAGAGNAWTEEGATLRVIKPEEVLAKIR